MSSSPALVLPNKYIAAKLHQKKIFLLFQKDKEKDAYLFFKIFIEPTKLIHLHTKTKKENLLIIVRFAPYCLQ